jgi:hypothetical protein
MMEEHELQEMERLAETLWDACYDAMWADFGYFGRFFDYWQHKRFYLTDEVSPAAEITCPTW